MTIGRAIAQAMNCRASHRGGQGSSPGHAGFLVGKVALGQVLSQYFRFPCQFSFHRLLHTHHLSSGALSYTANMFILMILFDFCLFLAQFCYSCTSGRLKAVCKSRTCVHIGKFPMARRTLFCRRCDFKR
jgi:hypothetical protein